MIKKLADWLYSISNKKAQLQKANELKKEPFVNKYFTEAMEKGEIETEVYFSLNDGTEVYLTKLGMASYENYLMATQEVPKQYEEFGMMRERLLKFINKSIELLEEAQYQMATEADVSHKKIGTSMNLLLGITSDLAFGSPVRRHIEMVMVFLNTKAMNPYNYDYSEKQELQAKILGEWDRLSFFLTKLPIWVLLGLQNPYEIDSEYYLHKEVMDRPEVKLQLAVLERIVLLGSSNEKEASKEILTEYMNLSALTKIAYPN